ncbi:MAG: hypothetical protein NPIRA03_25540 [Nitrospirales bacterium]|nr:MAG: hypothetical protein NPIRA03_25540 [Nitrospirales bacterium]
MNTKMIENTADHFEDEKYLERLSRKTPSSVWVLVIENKYGTQITAHSTAQNANNALYAYCAEWWDEFITEKYGVITELDRAEVIEAYFDYYASFHIYPEWYLLEECKLDDNL